MQMLELGPVRGLGLPQRLQQAQKDWFWFGVAKRVVIVSQGRQLDGVFALASAREIVWSHGLSPGADPLL